MTWLRALVVVAICVVAFVALWLPGARSALDPIKAVEAADFPNYYFGGERLLNDRPIYDPLTTEVRDEFGVSDYDTYPADPPATVALFAALSFLSYESAWWLWQIVSASLIAYSIIIVAREVGYFPQVAVAMAAFAFLTTPVRFLLTRNHMESLLLLLGVLGWRALRRETHLGDRFCGAWQQVSNCFRECGYSVGWAINPVDSRSVAWASLLRCR